MDLAVLGVKFIFFVGLVFFLIQSTLALIVFWRYSLDKVFPLSVGAAFVFTSLVLLSHALIVMGRL